MRDAAVRLLRSVIEGAPYASVQSQMAKALDFGLLRSRLARLYKARARPLSVCAVVVPLPGVPYARAWPLSVCAVVVPLPGMSR